MAADSTLTYDKTPPTRCGIDDVGGAALQNHPTKPPDPTKHPSAQMLNQVCKMVVSLGKFQPVMRASVTFSGGTPGFLYQVQARTDAVVLTLTDNGVGDTSITWPADSFPAPISAPGAHLNGTAAGMIAVEAISNGVRVRTKDGTNAAADLPFTVEAL